MKTLEVPVACRCRLTEATDALGEFLEDVVSEAQLPQALAPVVLNATRQRQQEVLRQVQLPLVANRGSLWWLFVDD